jgi:carbon monoxide dehydrogenase subunit G
MAIKFSGVFDVKKKPDEVYDFLTDPNRFAALVPDFQNLVVEDATHFTLKVDVSIAYIKSSADIKIELTEADRPRRAQYKGEGTVAGSNIIVIAQFDLLPLPEAGADGAVEIVRGTRVNWQGEAEISGRLASVAAGMLEPLGKKQIQKLIDKLRAALT